MRSNFEAAVTFMLPVNPYINHKEKFNKAPQIHDITLKGKTHSQTGVDFRWHTPDEYKLLTKEQKRELYDWQRTKERKEVTMKHRETSGNFRKNNLKRKLQARIYTLEIKIKESEYRNKELRNQLPHYNPEGSKTNHDIRSSDEQSEEYTFKVYSNSAQKIVKRKRKSM